MTFAWQVQHDETRLSDAALCVRNVSQREGPSVIGSLDHYIFLTSRAGQVKAQAGQNIAGVFSAPLAAVVTGSNPYVGHIIWR